ncbi:hypothetical protein BGZ67_009877 [Mortierella alpina]|nr:hypothetical protein BGZ67_009877 [Mortierella alpina]
MPTLKWKRSNCQLFSSARDRDKEANSGSFPATASSPPSISHQKSSTEHAPVPVHMQHHMGLPTVLALPEILLAISTFLNRSTVARCSTVCKEWRNIFQPLLFRVIEAADFDRPEFVRAFQDHTRFATSIEWIQESAVTTPAPKKQAWYRILRRKAPTKPATDNRKPFKQLENSLLAGDTPALETLSVRIQNQDPNLILRLPASTVANLQISTRGYPARKRKVYMEDILLAYPNLINLTLEGLFTLTSHLSEETKPPGNRASSAPSSPPFSSSAGSSAASPPVTPPVNTAAPAEPAEAGAAAGVLAATTTLAGLTISAPFSVVMSSGQSLAMSGPTGSSILPTPPSSAPAATANQSSSSSATADISVLHESKGKSVARRSSIETLNLRLVDISQDGLIAISSMMPRLRSLLIEEFLVPDMMIKIYRWTWSKQFIHSLRESFPQLRSLRLAIPFDTIKEDTIVEILKAFPLLTTVGFRNSNFGRLAMETLQEHCKLVECLDVSFGNANREFKGALLRFLQTWSRLRELEADGQVFHLDKPMDANVPMIPWACTKLEKLVCGFQGSESMIFRHLSQFPMLSSLTISYPALNISPTESTLAWMVKATRMEYFWFSQYRHLPLDKSTVHWILTHWPNLKILHVAGGMIEQKEIVKQWCRDAQRLSLVVEYDRI